MYFGYNDEVKAISASSYDFFWIHLSYSYLC